MRTPSITVVICSHNPEEIVLKEVLEGLRSQDYPLEKWSLLLVDNCSTNYVINKLDLSWHPSARIVGEVKPGLVQARLCGIRECSSPWICFVDDDNVLKSDYLSLVSEIVESEDYGVIGAGNIFPRYEVPPCPQLKSYMEMLALRSKSERKIISQARGFSGLPWEAGMVVSRQVSEAYAELCSRNGSSISLGRSGTMLLSGEDVEFSMLALTNGLPCLTEPRLVIEHLISRERVEVDYLLRLAEGHSYSEVLLVKKWLPGLLVWIKLFWRISLKLIKAFLDVKNPFRKKIEMRRLKGYLQALKA
jgi:glycosyltransferase involved in cell wall biosynthesis